LGDVFKVGFSRWIKSWKPIHLCWLFEKYGLAVPKYLIGGANKAPQYEGSRILNIVLGFEADEDVDVIDWIGGYDFVVSVGFGSQSGAQSGSRIVQLRWRNKSDGGDFAALGNTGQLTYNGTTSLVNGNTLLEAASGISAIQTTYDTGLGMQREGANDWTYNALSVDEWTACQWAIDTSNILSGKEYEFELYNVTDGVSIGVCLATLTTVVGDLSIPDEYEEVTVLENVEAVVGTVIIPDEFDAVTVLEDVDVEVTEAAADLEVDEFEGITVDEYVEGIHGAVLLDAYEEVAVDEDITAELSDLSIDEFGEVGTEEDVTAEVTAQPDLDVDVFETVTLEEDITSQIAHEFVLSLSDEFVDGAATTVQLLAPATKDTGDFQAGKIHESSNPADAIDLDADKYTEVEFCLKATEYAGEVSYDFRIEGLDTYTVTPQLTIIAGGETLAVNVHDCAETETCLV